MSDQMTEGKGSGTNSKNFFRNHKIISVILMLLVMVGMASALGAGDSSVFSETSGYQGSGYELVQDESTPVPDIARHRL